MLFYILFLLNFSFGIFLPIGELGKFQMIGKTISLNFSFKDLHFLSFNAEFMQFEQKKLSTNVFSINEIGKLPIYKLPIISRTKLFNRSGILLSYGYYFLQVKFNEVSEKEQGLHFSYGIYKEIEIGNIEITPIICFSTIPYGIDIKLGIKLL